MRREQKHDDGRRCRVRFWWMALLQLTLLVSWTASAKVCDAAAIDPQAATASELVEQENAKATDARETKAEATDGQAESQADPQGENQAPEKSETAESEIEKSEAEAAEKPESPAAKDTDAKDTVEKDTVEKDSDVKDSDVKDTDEKVAEEDQDSEAEGGDEKVAGDKQQSNTSTEADEAKKMKSDESPAENASEDVEAGDESADVENEPAIEVDPPEAVAATEVKKLDPSVPPKKTETKEKCVIGATATLLEKQSELLFRARVDSGAKSCSMHIEKMKIENEAEKMVDNIGKIVQFQVKNSKDKAHWLEGKIAGYVIIKTAQSKERRYKVPLTFRWKHMEKEVLVTLSDRNHMEYPLLLGRNFLRGDFLVDVELDSDD